MRMVLKLTLKSMYCETKLFCVKERISYFNLEMI
jgi:hypothetical protein